MIERGSMPMMGSKLSLEITSPQATGLGAIYRYFGRILGHTIDFSETVTHYIPGREKAWRTIGAPRLLIIDSYEMRVLVEPLSAQICRLTISIAYELPRSGIWRWIGYALAGLYAQWCLRSMIDGTARDLQRRSP